MIPLAGKNTLKTLVADSEATFTSATAGVLGYVAVDGGDWRVRACACIALGVAIAGYSLARPFKRLAAEIGGWSAAYRYRRERNVAQRALAKLGTKP